MTAATHRMAGLPAKQRREGLPPPLSLWASAAGLVVLLVAGLFAAPLFAPTPFPTEGDSQFYSEQLTKLDRQVRDLKAKGENPLSIVFVGTSRMKNAAFESDMVAKSARKAGVVRPVASTFIGINWGGFERLKPAIDMLGERRPDAVIMMPELLYEDLGYTARVRIFFRYLQSKLWGQRYSLFGDREYYIEACSGFANPVETRMSQHREWIATDEKGAGPRLARNMVRTLADQGMLVVIADVPTTGAMVKARAEAPPSEMAARSGFSALTNVRIERISSLPDAVYCDWAHMNPQRAGLWQGTLLGRIAADLNRPQG